MDYTHRIIRNYYIYIYNLASILDTCIYIHIITHIYKLNNISVAMLLTTSTISIRPVAGHLIPIQLIALHKGLAQLSLAPAARRGAHGVAPQALGHAGVVHGVVNVEAKEALKAGASAPRLSCSKSRGAWKK